MPNLHQLFSYVCGQVNLCVVAGVPLPSCQRCTGMYVGGVMAFILLVVFRPRPTGTVLWIHGLLMLFVVPFGYHWISAGGETFRIITGQMFGTGLVYYLAVNPMDSFGHWSDRRANTVVYFVFSIGAVVSLLLVIGNGSAATANVLSWVAMFGLVLMFSLALLTSGLAIARLVSVILERRQHRAA